LPASPCLSSRVETGIPIDARALSRVHAIESRVAQELRPRTVRCRLRQGRLVIELDDETLRRVSAEQWARLGGEIAAIADLPGAPSVELAAYRNGSAFLVPPA